MKGKTKKRQDKVLQKFKLLSFTACLLLIILVVWFVYSEFLIDHALFINPLSSIQNQTSQITDNLAKRHLSYVSIGDKNDYYKIVLNDNSIVLVAKNKSIDQQLSSLQLISSRLKIEGRVFKSLDLRFDQPVIKF